MLPERALGGVAGGLSNDVPDRQLELWEGYRRDALTSGRLRDLLTGLRRRSTEHLYRTGNQAHQPDLGYAVAGVQRKFHFSIVFGRGV